MNFLENLRSISQRFKEFISLVWDKISDAFINTKEVMLPFIFVALTYNLIDSWVFGLILGLLGIFYVDIKEYIDTKIQSIRIEHFDPETPKLIEPIIQESLNEYYLFHFLNQSGQRRYINEDQEIAMTNGVIDIFLAKINTSAIYDKCMLYYGDSFEEQMAIKISMVVTNFVIEVNTTPAPKKPYAENFMKDQDDYTDIMNDIGIHLK